MMKRSLNFVRKTWLFNFMIMSLAFIQEANARQKFWVPAGPPQAHYKIEARIALPDTVEGKETIAFTNTLSKPIESLAFDWTINDSRSIELSLDGKPLTILNTEKTPQIPSPLFYELPEAVRPGSKIRISVKFSAADLMPGDTKEIKLIDWYPRLWWDGLPVHDSFEVKLDIPSGYALAASGHLNKKTGYLENDGVKTFGIYLGKDLKTEEREVEGVRIVSLFTEKGSECARLCLKTAADVVGFYKSWLGFYPFKFLHIVPGAAMPMGGYPFASGIVVVHGQEQFDKRPLIFWKWITAHEIGHQYWGEYVMDNDTPSWLWIGMGIYADREYALFKGLGMETHTGLMSRYLSGARNRLDTTVDIPPAQLRKIKYDFNNIVIHGKGYSIISALECVLGKETFERIYRRCLKDYRGKSLGYKEFWRVSEQESGENLNWFFDQWLRSNNYLCFQIVSQESVKEGGKYVSTVKVECLGSLEMPVPVKAVFEDGLSQVKFTNRFFRVNSLRFESKAKLKEAVLNPDKKLAMLEAPLPTLPEELLEMISQLAWTGSGEKALRAYEKAKSLKLDDAGSWFKLGLTLFDGGYYRESFEAFQRVTELNPPQVNRFSSLVWMGHLKDLEGSREEALKYYNEALKYDTGQTLRHDQWGMRINRQWIEDRLKTPFKWGKK